MDSCKHAVRVQPRKPPATTLYPHPRWLAARAPRGQLCCVQVTLVFPVHGQVATNRFFKPTLTTTGLDYEVWNFTITFPRPVTNFYPLNGRDITINGAVLAEVSNNTIDYEFVTFFTGRALMRDDVATMMGPGFPTGLWVIQVRTHSARILGHQIPAE
eukprot:1180357-Prorocentrum_minimum.AAC.3